MSDPIDALVLDLLEWIGSESRPYAEVMEAWRTSCPRLTVWEDANRYGFVSRVYQAAHGEVMVSVTTAGAQHLQSQRPAHALSC